MADTGPDRHRPAGRCGTFLTGFESTYVPAYDVDCLETAGHVGRWRADLDSVAAGGVRTVRYPLRWHRIEREPDRFDWRGTDEVLTHLRDSGVEPIVDLIHHTSYPRWLSRGFADARFGGAYLRFAEAVAHRYPWLTSYTLFNEPFSTLFLAGHEALWPPYGRGDHGLVALLRSVLPALSEAAAAWREALPAARHIWVDTCEHHAGAPGAPARFAEVNNDRRFVLLDLMLGRPLDVERPYVTQLLAAGARPLLEIPPLRIDVLGLDYYPHSEWFFDDRGGRSPSPRPVGFAALAARYARRYGVPVMLTETNIRGLPSDRASWLRYMLEQYERARAAGVPLEGFCWFPYVDSRDWDSLLARAAGRRDPVGVVDLGPDGHRVRTSMTASWEAAVAGTPAAELPAYRFQPPVADRLAGYLPQMAHWPWREPPAHDRIPPIVVPGSRAGTTPPSFHPGTKEPTMSGSTTEADLVVLSHLQWSWVWQRPQHLVSRLARRRAAAGAVTWFVEEPLAADVDAPVLRREDNDVVRRVWLEVPRGQAGGTHLSFDAPASQGYPRLLAELLDGRRHRDVWVYTALALDAALALEPRVLVYDVMDDLSSFMGAAEALRLLHRRALAEADVVFTGGRSLHRGVTAQRRRDVHLFPSGVEAAHYERARHLRRPRDRRVAGYVGVLDERLDLRLLTGLVGALPDWTFELVGPVAKIDPALLPQAPNVRYPGMRTYDDLPEVMAGFDVALMPFAHTEATRSISPTKTLEYLAAGLPVVSTRVPDVVADFADVVRFADDAAGFAAACVEAATRPATTEHARRLRLVRVRHEWDTIAEQMAALVDRAAAGRPGHTTGATVGVVGKEATA